PDSSDAEPFSQFDKVRVFSHQRRGITFFIKLLLPLPDHPERFIVDNDHFDRQLMLLDDRKLLHRHLETAVSDYRYHCLLRTPELGSDGCRQAEPHRPQTTRSHPFMWFIELVELCRPHLVLSDIRRNDGLSVCFTVQLLNQPLR